MESVDVGRPEVEFRVLGPIAVAVEGADCGLGGARQRQLLGLLLLHAGHVVSVSTLAEHLWSDETRPDDPGRAIRTYVSRLRRSLSRAGVDGDRVISTSAPGYRLVADRASIDSERFEQFVAAARRTFDGGDADRAAALLRSAFELWRGEPYAEFAGHDWIEAESIRLLELRRAAEVLWCEARIEVGEHAEVIGQLGRMVADDPLHARPVTLLMTALARSDRQAEALRAAAHHRRAMRDVGLDVTAPIVELEARVAAADDSLGSIRRHDDRRRDAADGETTSSTTARQASSALPTFDDRLIGRDTTVSQLGALVVSERLVTVTGLGGIGKTRVAVAAAADVAERFPDGVWFCDLAGVDDPRSVVQVVADAVGARQRRGRSMLLSLAEYLRDRESLVVLDNCEHVLDEVAEIVEAAAKLSDRVTFLATSREPLAVRREVTFPLDPLGVDGLESPAVQLFEGRSRHANPTVTWSSADLASIGRICARLDGIPLAVELAAARTRTSSPAEIEQRLDVAFREFRGARRGDARHRTMEAAIDSSYAALDADERRLLGRLSVFRGGCDIESIEAVCVDEGDVDRNVSRLLERLVEASLVVTGRSTFGGTRYRLLEPVRQFVADRTGDAVQGTRVRHLDYFTQWAEAWHTQVWGRGTDLLARLEAETANLRSAVDRAIETDDVDRALRIVCAVRSEGFIWDRHEAADWGRRVIELDGAVDHPLGPTVASHVAMVSWWRGDLASFAEFLDRAESMPAFDPHACRPAVNRALQVRHVFGDQVRAAQLLDDIRPADVRDRSEVAFARVQMMTDAEQKGRGATAIQQLQRDAEETGSDVLAILAGGSESVLLLGRGEFEESLARAREAVRLARDIGAGYLVHFFLFGLGLAAGAAASASSDDLVLMREGLRDQRDAGNESDQWLILVGAAAALRNPVVAGRVQRGIQSSMFANSRIAEMLPLYFPDTADITGDETVPDDVDDLVEAVGDAIDRTLDDVSSPTPTT